MQTLHLKCHRELHVVTLTMEGRLDGNSATVFSQFVADQLVDADAAVVIDATGLIFVSSAGMRELLMLAKRLHRHRAKAAIFGTPAMVLEALQIGGLDTLFTMVEDLTAAQKAVSRHSRLTDYLGNFNPLKKK